MAQWTTTLRGVGPTPAISIPHVQGHTVNPVHAYKDLLSVSLTTHTNQPLLTITLGGTRITVAIPMLVTGLKVLLQTLDLNPSLYSLHSLRRSGATAAYQVGSEQIYIKHHRLWNPDAFWMYMTSLCVASSPVIATFTSAMN